jgi:hypothetical protein
MVIQDGTGLIEQPCLFRAQMLCPWLPPTDPPARVARAISWVQQIIMLAQTPPTEPDPVRELFGTLAPAFPTQAIKTRISGGRKRFKSTPATWGAFFDRLRRVTWKTLKVQREALGCPIAAWTALLTPANTESNPRHSPTAAICWAFLTPTKSESSRGQGSRLAPSQFWGSTIDLHIWFNSRLMFFYNEM